MASPKSTTLSPLDWDLGHVPPGIPWGGVDEAGRGAWAGPVVAACAVLDHACAQKWGHVLRSARDSKQLSAAKRQGLAAELKTLLPAWSVCIVDHLTIDRDNILEATLAAMRGSVRGVCEKKVPRMLFVDGDRAPRTGLPERLLVDGDTFCCAVACASILAKTHRDQLMEEIDLVCPGYGFASHKGYGTAKHRQALTSLGPCPIHRLSYAPVNACQQPPDRAVQQKVEEALHHTSSPESLQAWVDSHLRPHYHQLGLDFVESLRERYATHMVALMAQQASSSRT